MILKCNVIIQSTSEASTPSRTFYIVFAFEEKPASFEGKMQDKDLLYPSLARERSRHKKKRLVQSPNSYFMDVKCTGCYTITTIFSHAQTVVPCAGCSLILCQPAGGKCRLTEGCAFRKKKS
ncbi:small ribosomal subunit protein eS27-like [Pungitius pungitius]|uniref:small ribosomal subunit protein eS27-like n=1 Tax=Pungitius pungitius TaxID=134920 RepID=UPI002E133140